MKIFENLHAETRFPLPGGWVTRALLDVILSDVESDRITQLTEEGILESKKECFCPPTCVLRWEFPDRGKVIWSTVESTDWPSRQLSPEESFVLQLYFFQLNPHSWNIYSGPGVDADPVRICSIPLNREGFTRDEIELFRFTSDGKASNAYRAEMNRRAKA